MTFFSQTNVTADRLASVKTFLDIGCGDGRLPIWLKRKYPNIEKADGFDYSSVRISIARKSVKMLGLEDSVQFSCSDVNFIFDMEIPYKYDLIAITEVLEHLQDPYSIIAKAHKFLSPNGRIVGTVPHRFAYNAHLQVHVHSHYTSLAI
jgi:2-polyprenyl-3-methyl-5-hydroxy-6-metoxy-1,4-benzoquinol methylase